MARAPIRRRVRATRLVAIAALASLATSCTVSLGEPGPPTPPTAAASSSPSPTATASPTGGFAGGAAAPRRCGEPLNGFALSVRGGRGVSSADVAEVGRDAREARSFYRAKVPLCDRGRVVVRVLGRSKGLVAAQTHVSDVPAFRIDVFTGGAAWARTPSSYRTVIVLHEWYHVLQFAELDCGPPMCRALRGHVPDWLIEGSAVYESLRAADDLQVLPYGLSRSAEIRIAAADHEPLERLEDIRVPGANYAVAFAAAELLSSLGGRDALRRFWERAGASGRWQDAFRQVFHRSVDAFYRRFAAYRAAGFRG